MNTPDRRHTKHSSFREKLIEHLLIGELLKLSWEKYNCQIEISKPEVDNSGYDILVEANNILRHIQLKTSYIGSTTSYQKVHVKLGDKPAGCIVWIYFDVETLSLGPFYYFGSDRAKPLKSFIGSKVAKHSKGNKDGVKAERPNIRVINKGQFKVHNDIESLYNVLFNWIEVE